MEFGWLNIFGACIVVLMLVPNIIYAIGNKGEVNHCTNKLMNLVEQIGRYACIVLMWFPLMVWKFGFASKIAMMSYFLGNGLLLLIYWIVFFIFMKGKSRGRALVLAIVPSCIFLLSGILLGHWLLVCFAVLFAFGHAYVTIKNV